MLANQPVIAFVPTRNSEVARRFYEDCLGLHLVSEEPWAIVFDLAGSMLRVQKVEAFTPHPFTTEHAPNSSVRIAK